MRDGGFNPVIECTDFPTCNNVSFRENLGYVDFVINSVIAGYGQLDCPFEICYDPNAAIPIPLTLNRARCCLPLQTRVPSVIGGKFAIGTKGAESLSDATSIWNPACSDTLNFVAYYINLLQSSIGHEMRLRLSVADTSDKGRSGALRLPREATAERCGSICTAEKPVCRKVREENRSAPYPQDSLLFCRNTNGGDDSKCPTYDTGYDCEQPGCQDVVEFCGSSLPVGVRSRQICPITCGCDSPRSPLALYLPTAGCPPSCWGTTRYRAELTTTPCLDITNATYITHPTWVQFLDNWATAADVWPKDWKESGLIYVDMFRRFGCHYLWMNSPADALDYETSGLVVINASAGEVRMPADQPLFWPAHFGAGVSPCMEAGFYYPVKPISYFCPEACGCRAGDKHCPDTCPARINEANGLGQQNYAGNVGGNLGTSGGGSNPSPLNVVPDFPWRVRGLTRSPSAFEPVPWEPPLVSPPPPPVAPATSPTTPN